MSLVSSSQAQLFEILDPDVICIHTVCLYTFPRNVLNPLTQKTQRNCNKFMPKHFAADLMVAILSRLYIILCNILFTYCYWYSITHSLFHSRLNFFCKSFPSQPFLFFLQVSLHGFPQTAYCLLLAYPSLLFLFLHFLVVVFRAVELS